MRRRTFLAAAALALEPGWLRRAFADATVPPSVEAERLRAALEVARRAGRAVVVLVVPEQVADKDDRGHAFGEWINHGDDEALAPLGAAEVVCAKMAAVRQVVADAPHGEPLMIVVDGAGRVRALDGALPRLEWLPGGAARRSTAADQSTIDRRIALLSGVVRSAVPVAPGDVSRLAARARANLTRQAPAGARWARATYCGAGPEGEENRWRGKCGMAHVPERSARFLSFYTRAK